LGIGSSIQDTVDVALAVDRRARARSGHEPTGLDLGNRLDDRRHCGDEVIGVRLSCLAVRWSFDTWEAWQR